MSWEALAECNSPSRGSFLQKQCLNLLEQVLWRGRSGCNLRLAREGAEARLVVVPVAAEPECVPVSMRSPPSILE